MSGAPMLAYEELCKKKVVTVHFDTYFVANRYGGSQKKENLIFEVFGSRRFRKKSFRFFWVREKFSKNAYIQKSVEIRGNFATKLPLISTDFWIYAFLEFFSRTQKNLKLFFWNVCFQKPQKSGFPFSGTHCAGRLRNTSQNVQLQPFFWRAPHIEPSVFWGFFCSFVF